MSHLGLAAKAVGALMAAALIGGCTATPVDSPSPTVPTPSPTATPTPTLSPEDQKLADAKARVVVLWATLDKLLVDPSSRMNALDEFAAEDALTTMQLNVTIARQRETVQVGATVVREQTAVAKGDSWIVTSCVDRTNATMNAKDGRPVTPKPDPRLSHQNTLRVLGGYLKVVEDQLVGSC